MAQNKVLNIEPFALTGSIQNILNSAIASLSGPVGYTQTQPYILVKHIRAINTNASPATVSLYKGGSGASAADTSFAWSAAPIPANGSIDAVFANARFDAADFLTGLASTTGVVLVIEGEIGLS